MFMTSWLCAGVGVIGQPHIMTIAMTVESGDSIAKARPIYFAYYILFSAACILVGLCCRALLKVPPEDREISLILLSLDQLPQILVGLMLAGLFAASVSTADTQLLCCSAALSQDIVPGLGRTSAGTKALTPLVIGMALAAALWGRQSVFQLVVLAWSALAAGLGPLVIIRSMNWRISRIGAVAVMLGGLGAALVWKYGLGLSDSVYEVLPGMVAGLLVYAAVRPGSVEPDPER
jgi:sodium/proline symporter